jgi:hypothetical protein
VRRKLPPLLLDLLRPPLSRRAGLWVRLLQERRRLTRRLHLCKLLRLLRVPRPLLQLRGKLKLPL